MIVVGTVVEIYNVERRRETLSENQTFSPAQEKELNKFFFHQQEKSSSSN